MPVYEYRCENEKCEFTDIEILKEPTEYREDNCPKCGSKMRHKICASSFHIKGHSYRNGYSAR